MSKLYKILWLLVLLFIIATVLTFTFGLLLVGVIVAGLLGICRYCLLKKRSKQFTAWPKSNSSISTIEIIDIKRKASSDNPKDDSSC